MNRLTRRAKAPPSANSLRSQDPNQLDVAKLAAGGRPDPLAVGQRIKGARKKLGLSQHALGLQLGITPGAVGQWEIGECLPKMDKLSKLSSTLEMTPNEILYGDKPPGDDENPGDVIAERRIVEISRDVGKEGRLAMMSVGEHWGDIHTGDALGVVEIIEQWAAMPHDMRDVVIALVHSLDRNRGTEVGKLIKQWGQMTERNRAMILEFAEAIVPGKKPGRPRGTQKSAPQESVSHKSGRKRHPVT